MPRTVRLKTGISECREIKMGFDGEARAIVMTEEGFYGT